MMKREGESSNGCSESAKMLTANSMIVTRTNDLILSSNTDGERMSNTSTSCENHPTNHTSHSLSQIIRSQHSNGNHSPRAAAAASHDTSYRNALSVEPQTSSSLSEPQTPLLRRTYCQSYGTDTTTTFPPMEESGKYMDTVHQEQRGEDKEKPHTVHHNRMLMTMIFAAIAMLLGILVNFSNGSPSSINIPESIESKVWNLIYGSNDYNSYSDSRHKFVLRQRRNNDSPSSKLKPFKSFKLLNSNSKSSVSDSKLVVAGQLSVGDGPCNIAELGLSSNEWSLNERIQLILYNSYSGGKVYYLLTNHTFSSAKGRISGGGVVGDGGDGEWDGDKEITGGGGGRLQQTAGGQLIVVGAFDTTDRNSQVTYCSVGAWDGTDLSKVGEGLCDSAVLKGMKVTAAALAGPQDIFVAGSFQTQVWNGNGHEFVSIKNIAHYNANEQVWMPLSVGQITCSWCTVTILSLAWDSTRKQLHVAGKFNAIDGKNIPSGLAIYHKKTGHLVAHPGGGLTMYNKTEDGVGTALQLDEEAGVLYVMGSFQKLSNGEDCLGLAAYEIEANHWSCLADAAHTVLPSGGGNMLLTPYGLMVAGRTTVGTTWPDNSKPYTIALLKTTPKNSKSHQSNNKNNNYNTNLNKDTTGSSSSSPIHDFEWSWLPGFDGHDKPLHSLANGFAEHEGVVFIAGDDLVAKWLFVEQTITVKNENPSSSESKTHSNNNNMQTNTRTEWEPTTVNLSSDVVRGAILAIAQLSTSSEKPKEPNNIFGYRLAVYLIAVGAVVGMLLALLLNRHLTSVILSTFSLPREHKGGIRLDTLAYSVSVNDAYQIAMRNRCVQSANQLPMIDPSTITLHRIIGQGTFGRVWSAGYYSSSVAVKEFVFAQAAVAGHSSQQESIIQDIVGEAGIMSILRHPNVLQLFGCSMTAQAIWIVSELCSLGSLRQLLDNESYTLSTETLAKIALQVAEGMMYLHNQNPPIIHRDLKSHNILIHETYMEAETADGRTQDCREIHSREVNNLPYRVNRTERMDSKQTIVAKIGDWGSAKATIHGSQTMTHGVGTPCWLAPEVITNARCSKYSDVYSFAIILWELASRKKVYADLEPTQIIAQVANDNLRPTPIPENCPWAAMMIQSWNEDPRQRPTFEDIVRCLNEIIDDCNLSYSLSDTITDFSPTGSDESFQQNSERAVNNDVEEVQEDLPINEATPLLNPN